MNQYSKQVCCGDRMLRLVRWSPIEGRLLKCETCEQTRWEGGVE